MLSEGHRQLKHVGYLLVLHMGRETRTLVGDNEKKNGKRVFIIKFWYNLEFITVNLSQFVFIPEMWQTTPKERGRLGV